MAFPPGVHYAVPTLPNVTVVNELGDFGLAADRLAFIDGEGAFRLSALFYSIPIPFSYS